MPSKKDDPAFVASYQIPRRLFFYVLAFIGSLGFVIVSGIMIVTDETSLVERMSRRQIYTPVPSVTGAREQALVLLERQPKPVSLMVGVGF